MGRNFFRRIETCVPIIDPKLKRRLIKEGLRICLEDNVNAWEMQSDGTYRRKGARATALRAGNTAGGVCTLASVLNLRNYRSTN